MGNSTAITTSHSWAPFPAGLPALTTPGGTAYKPHTDWKPRPLSSNPWHTCPAPQDYRLTRAETAAVIRNLQLGSKLPNPLPAAAAPAQGSGAGWLGAVLDYLRSRTTGFPGVAGSPLPQKESCPADDPDCDGAGTADLEPPAPKPYAPHLSGFVLNVDQDIFTVSMPHHLKDRQDRLGLDEVHVLIVLHHIGFAGRDEAERLLRAHFQWAGDARPELRVSCFTGFSNMVGDLKPDELCPRGTVIEVQKAAAPVRRLRKELEDYVRSRNLLDPKYGLGKLSVQAIEEQLLPAWKHAYRDNPAVQRELDQKVGMLIGAQGGIQLSVQLQMFGALDDIQNKLAEPLPKGRCRVSVVGDIEYQQLGSRLNSLRRMVRLVEKTPETSS